MQGVRQPKACHDFRGVQLGDPLAARERLGVQAPRFERFGQPDQRIGVVRRGGKCCGERVAGRLAVAEVQLRAAQRGSCLNVAWVQRCRALAGFGGGRRSAFQQQGSAEIRVQIGFKACRRTGLRLVQLLQERAMLLRLWRRGVDLGGLACALGGLFPKTGAVQRCTQLHHTDDVGRPARLRRRVMSQRIFQPVLFARDGAQVAVHTGVRRRERERALQTLHGGRKVALQVLQVAEVVMQVSRIGLQSQAVFDQCARLHLLGTLGKRAAEFEATHQEVAPQCQRRAQVFDRVAGPPHAALGEGEKVERVFVGGSQSGRFREVRKCFAHQLLLAERIPQIHEQAHIGGEQAECGAVARGGLLQVALIERLVAALLQFGCADRWPGSRVCRLHWEWRCLRPTRGREPLLQRLEHAVAFAAGTLRVRLSRSATRSAGRCTRARSRHRATPI